MSDWAIRACGLSKQYRIGSTQKYDTLRDSLSSFGTAPLRLAQRLTGRGSNGVAQENLIWALKDVSFEIPAGEVVGIIGSNGAGKSTLLKVLSRITSPSAGYADVRGRVGSLLEVGTGFHPELTGRENIYLNGAILGMTRQEIETKFGEIVAFSGVEKFIETPVKRYSSGMYLRLAFSVAAHLEPDILLVDEVLAVGDSSFQKKCIGRMQDVAKKGRTVLFVSHNMGAIRSLCTKGIYIEHGDVAVQGDINQCIRRYFHAIGAVGDVGGNGLSDSNKTGFGRISIGKNEGNTAKQDEPLSVSTVMRLQEDCSGFYLFCTVEDMFGGRICQLQLESSQLGFSEVKSGDYSVSLSLRPLWLTPGLYSMQFKLMPWGQHSSRSYISDSFPIDIKGEITSSSQIRCVLQPPGEWNIERASA